MASSGKKNFQRLNAFTYCSEIWNINVEMDQRVMKRNALAIAKGIGKR